jgi:hypothetical protein
MKELSAGFYFIATGGRFLNEACRSAERIRSLMPGFPLAIASNLSPPKDLFNHHIAIANPQFSFSDKIGPLFTTPFEKTVFLDTDTWLCTPVKELFEVLDRYDMALARAPMRETAGSIAPACFSELNTGVIAYQKNEVVFSVISRWAAIYEERMLINPEENDQPALRDALWLSQASLLVLPAEYNFRFIMPSFAGRGSVKILHGRHYNYPSLERLINRSRSPRVFLPRLRDAVSRHFIIHSIPGIWLGYFIGCVAWMAGVFGKTIDGIRWRVGRRG